jgi:hypothetical protein
MKVGFYDPINGEIYKVFEFPDSATPPDPDDEDAEGIILDADQGMPGYVLSGDYYAIPDAPSPSHIWNWTTLEWEEDIATAKANKWTEIKAARDAQESGTFTYDTDVYQCDVDSRANIMSYADRAQREDPNWNVDWRLADNTYVNLDGGQMVEMHDAMNEHIKTTHATAKDLWDDIQAAATVEDVEAIVWP